MREEYFAALAEGAKHKAKWIRFRDTANLGFVFVEYIIASVIDRVLKIGTMFSTK